MFSRGLEMHHWVKIEIKLNLSMFFAQVVFILKFNLKFVVSLVATFILINNFVTLL